MNELIIEKKRTVLVTDQRVVSYMFGILHDLGYNCYASMFTGDNDEDDGAVWVLNYRMDQIKHEWILNGAKKKFEDCQIREGLRINCY